MNSISFPVRSSYTDYGKFANGKKIQKAADGAAELAIIQKQEEQIRGYEAGKKNLSVMKSLTNVTEVAQSGVNDYLQRMNELTVRSSGSLMSQSDKESIQQEIDALKDGISQITSSANFNEKKLMDGSNPSLNAAIGSGTMSSIATGNSSLETLGLGDFSITGKYSSRQITSALSAIGDRRAANEMDALNEKSKTVFSDNLNERKLMNAAAGSGTMATIATGNSTLETQGLANFSIQEKNSSKQITNALTAITQQRAKNGAQTNGLEYAYRSQANASYNTTAAQSRIGDLDYPKAISEQRKKEVLQEYSNYMQKANMRMQADKMVFFE